MELESIRRFVSVVELGSVRSSAQALHVAPSSISRSLSQLEAELGAPLLDAKREQLTEAGRIALPVARQILAESDRLRVGIADFVGQRGTIRAVACSPSPLWLLSRAAERAIPGTILTSDIVSSSTAAARRLSAREVDVAITTAPMASPLVESAELMHERLLACVPKGTPLASRQSCRFSDFDGKTVVVFKGIGFWLDLCRTMAPGAHFVVQEDRLVFLSTVRACDAIHFEVESPELPDAGVRGELELDERHVLVPVCDEGTSVTYYANWMRESRAPIARQLERLLKAVGGAAKAAK